MNFSQKLGLFALIVISVAYVYFSFFNKDGFDFDINLGHNEPNVEDFQPLPNLEDEPEIQDSHVKEKRVKTIKIFISDSNGKLRSVNRECDLSVQNSCFEYAINELVSAPSKWEKSKGFTSEIPQGTRVLSIREGSNSIMLDLSPAFESGGGSDSIYRRLYQLIKTVNVNTKTPVYLYINGKQVDVIGGDGIMIKQPLNERSLDE